MRIDLVTIFPDFFDGPLSHSLLKQAVSRKKVSFYVHNLRDFTQDKHRTVDEKPFGGGPGMVFKPEPIFKCVEAISGKGHVVLLSPRGKPWTQELAHQLARKRHLILICGHYEGVDERVSQHLVDEEISVGDFVTMGGEAPALCLVESIVRLIPGVLGNPESSKEESFTHSRNGVSGKRLEFPQYTRPRVFKGWNVPKILLSGNHRAVAEWRKKESLRTTRKRRPDLIKKTQTGKH
ncbi:MAG: tRNA (guanosine(37)-N1)-methyltransferase TrmD [Candidatus Omnitrophica bacterium]|nr:tRNA (guanosine(37)-N1)-methyltransferase TrmD [Candidatus Omnitrophota bacterium]